MTGDITKSANGALCTYLLGLAPPNPSLEPTRYTRPHERYLASASS